MRDYEDICQDTFLKSFQFLHTYHGKCRFSTWVAQISFYEISNRFRKLRGKKEVLIDSENFERIVLNMANNS